MSPFRALLTARLQVLWNLAHRGKGTLGTVAAIVIFVVAIACLIPPFYMFLTFGGLLGQDLPAEGSPAMTWLSGLHALLVFGLGGMAGLRHQAGFDRETLRLFPLRPVQYLLAELPFNLIDTIPVLGFVLFLGLGAGLARAQPSSWLHVVLAVGQGMLGILLVQQLVGSARRLITRSRVLTILAAIVGLLVVAFVLLSTERGLEGALHALIALLPTTAGYHALRASALGDGGAAALFQAAGLAWTAVLFAAATWLNLQELHRDPPPQAVRKTEERTWTFRTPAEGVARLLVSQVAGARAGQLVLVLPVFCCGMFVLAADIVRRSVEGRHPTGFFLTAQTLFAKATAQPLYLVVPVAVVLFNRDLWMNQFAWHGGGIKSLFLAPIRTADVLRGTLRGLFLLQLPQALVSCAPLLRLRMPGAWELLTGLAAATLAAVTLALLGHVWSARHPRVLAARGERMAAPPAPLTLIATAAVVALAFGTWGVVRVLGPLAGWAPAAALLLLAVAALAVHRSRVERLAESVDDCREVLVETLG